VRTRTTRIKASSEPEQTRPRVTRRGFMRTALGVTLAVSAAGGLGALYALKIEPGWVQVVQRDVHLPRLTPAFDGFTIAQLSDIHRGPYMSEESLLRVVGMVNSLSPDLVVLTGDFVAGQARFAPSCARALAQLAAPHGVWAVLGNHDVWSDAGAVAYALEQANVRVLRDARHSIALEDQRLWLLGLEDMGVTGFMGTPFDGFRRKWSASVAALGDMLGDIPQHEPRLLLVHNPDVNELLAQVPIDLALCGHTHGGQVRLPLLGSPIVPSYLGEKYVCGLVEGPGSLVYINRGLGVITPPVRLNCRPELTLLRLRPL
jgi:predicted MPP superfamily phosphohydrolase